MTLTIPCELEQALQTRAQQRQITLDQAVGEALKWYLSLDADLLDELDAWQEVRDEALQLVEEPRA